MAERSRQAAMYGRKWGNLRMYEYTRIYFSRKYAEFAMPILLSKAATESPFESIKNIVELENNRINTWV